jgi:hypothetical protein
MNSIFRASVNFSRRSQYVQQELDRFVAASDWQQTTIIDGGGEILGGSEAHQKLLACLILHPRVPMELKERCIDKIKRSVAPAPAAGILRAS